MIDRCTEAMNDWNVGMENTYASPEQAFRAGWEAAKADNLALVLKSRNAAIFAFLVACVSLAISLLR